MVVIESNGFAELIVAAKNMLQFIDEGSEMLSLEAGEMIRVSKGRREEHVKLVTELRNAVAVAHDGPPDEDWFEEAISDTIDMDWRPRYAAKAIVRDWASRWYAREATPIGVVRAEGMENG